MTRWLRRGSRSVGDIVRLILPAAPQYVSLARLAAGEAAMRAGLDLEASDDVRLAVSEACTNAMRHASRTAAIRLEMIVEGGSLVVDVERAEASHVSAPLGQEQLDEDALGLVMISGLTDELDVGEVEGRGHVIRFVKRATPRT